MRKILLLCNFVLVLFSCSSDDNHKMDSRPLVVTWLVKFVNSDGEPIDFIDANELILSVVDENGVAVLQNNQPIQNTNEVKATMLEDGKMVLDLGFTYLVDAQNKMATSFFKLKLNETKEYDLKAIYDIDGVPQIKRFFFEGVEYMMESEIVIE